MGRFWSTLRINGKNGGILSRGAMLTLTISEVCPIKCRYCPMWVDRTEYPKFDKCSLAEWKTFLTDFPEWISLIAICGGEPTLVDWMPELVSWLLGRGHHVLLYSNLLRPDRILEINKSYLFTIQSTYHEGDDAERYDKAYRRIKDAGYRIDSLELKTPTIHPYSRLKPFFSQDDIRAFKDFHASPDSPKTKVIYCGAEQLYRESK